MAVTSKGKMVRFTAANDVTADYLMIQTIAVMSNSATNAGYATLTDDEGNFVFSCRVGATGNVVVPFPAGLGLHGLKVTDLSNCEVYVFLA